MDKSEKELKVMSLLLEHGVDRTNAIIVISELWSEQDLDEIISLPPEKQAEIAQDMKELL